MTVPAPQLVSGSRGATRWLASATIVPLLGWLVFKPIALFVYVLSHLQNRLGFVERRDLARRVRTARRGHRPVLFASNHVSMFDDPVVPMALFRSGPRSLLDMIALGIAVGVGAVTAPRVGPVVWLLPVLVGVSLGNLGARKVWWSLGDLVNFSGAAALRAKMAASGREPSVFARLLLAIADPLIRAFMRSAIVKTIFVDRRPGDEAKALRARATKEAARIAASGEPIWVFIEGGRSRDPDVIRPARRGIGDMVQQLCQAGPPPLVVVVHQRGLERVIPIGSRRWLSTGHDIDVRWTVFELTDERVAAEPQEIADAVRGEMVALQAERRASLGEARDR